jgi:hypothetical protein
MQQVKVSAEKSTYRLSSECERRRMLAVGLQGKVAEQNAPCARQ